MCDLAEGHDRMEFNRKGPEGGVEIYSTIRNNRAFLECKIHLQKTRAEELLEEVEDITGVGYPPGEQCIQEAGDVAGTEGTVLRVKKGYLDIRVWDREERLVLQCRHSLEQEELAEGILLQPNLWQGVPDPYLYRIRIALIEKGNSVTDVLEDYFALRDLHEVSGKGWMLNGAPFPLRPVAYAIPTPLTCGEEIQTRMHEDLKLIRDMGANVVCPIESKITREFCRVCDELGLVVWWTDARKAKSGKQEEIPRFHGGFGELFLYRSISLRPAITTTRRDGHWSLLYILI